MCCASDTPPPPETMELQFGKLTLRRKKAHCGWSPLPGFFFFFFFESTFFQCACVHKKWGLTHRPQSWLTTSGRSSVGSKTVRNRGATPKCHHSCKTAEHKSQITEICTPRPPNNENRAVFEWLLPEECSGSCPALCFVGFTMNKELQIPQLLADIRVHVWVAVWKFILGQPRYYCAMLLPIKPNTQWICCSHTV